MSGPLYAGVATIGFALLFRVPRRQILAAGLGGGFGWWVYLVLLGLTRSAIFATLIAAVWIGAYGEVCARLARKPATLFTTCAILPLVPGKGIFETMVAAVRHDPDAAVRQGLWTIAVAGAIATGLALVAAVMPRARTPR